MKSQQRKILEILMDQSWHCTSEMYALYIADPRKRLNELKKQGYNLVWRWCETHKHNKSKEWMLLNAKDSPQKDTSKQIENSEIPSNTQTRQQQMRPLWN